MTALRAIITTLIAILVLWEAVVILGDMKPFLLPGPLRVAEAMASSWQTIAENAVVTLTEIVLGLIFGLGVGVLTAIQLAMVPALRDLARPVLVFLQAVPFFALAPILTFWFGYGMTPKIIMATLIIYFPVTSAFYDGLARTPQPMLDMARTMGASDLRTLFLIRVPAAFPSLGSGLRLGAVFTPIGAVIGEWVGGSGAGLGYLMLLANGRAKIDLMFACVVVLAVVTVALYYAVDALVRRYLSTAPP